MPQAKELRQNVTHNSLIRTKTHWKKGFFIGALLGFIYQSLLALLGRGYLGGIFQTSSFSGESQFLNFVPVVLSSTHPLNQVPIELSTFIAVVIWYGLLGLVIGLIYSILRSRVQNKKVFYVLLCSSVILIIGTIIIVNYYTLLLVFNA